MKWFKHDSAASLDAKLRKVRLKYGMEGYGTYWYLLEMIAQGIEKHNLNFELEHDAEIIAGDTNIHVTVVNEMMAFMVDLGLFEMGQGGTITCLKMATRTDDYTQKLIQKGCSDRKFNYYIYFISSEDAGSVKIGVSKNPWARCRDFQTGHAEELSVLATVKTQFQTEKHVTIYLKSKHKRGEWYIFDEDMREIVSLASLRETVTCEDLIRVIKSVVGTTEQLRNDYEVTKSGLIEENRTEQNRNKRATSRRSIFEPPTQKEVAEYIVEKKYQDVDAEQFVAFYESKGWLVGKAKMKDWRSAVRGWESRAKKNPKADHSIGAI